MTCKEMLPAVGEMVRVKFESLWIECKVHDVKTAWGKARLLVRPVAGQGEQWVELGRLETRRTAQVPDWAAEAAAAPAPEWALAAKREDARLDRGCSCSRGGSALFCECREVK